MVWFKRIAALVVLLGAVFGGIHLNHRYRQAEEKTLDTCALVTARIWVARVRFRNAPEPYLIYRDEILQAAGISLDDVRHYLKMYEEQPIGATVFSRKVKGYVDSILTASGY